MTAYSFISQIKRRLIHENQEEEIIRTWHLLLHIFLLHISTRISFRPSSIHPVTHRPMARTASAPPPPPLHALGSRGK